MKTEIYEWLNKFVYNVLYPGILGSMIFEFLDPVRNLHFLRVLPLSIALIYVVDHFHMIQNLKADEKKICHPLMDASIAIFFCASYFLPSRAVSFSEALEPEYCTYGLAGLAVSFYIMILYDKYYLKGFKGRLVPKLLPFTITIIAFLAICLTDFYENIIYLTLLSTLIAFLTYLNFVIVWRHENLTVR